MKLRLNMRRLLCFFYCLSFWFVSGQQISIISGQVLDEYTLQPMLGVSISLADFKTNTDASGFFVFDDMIAGEYELIIDYDGYEEQRYYIKKSKDSKLDIGIVLLKPNPIKEHEEQFVLISDAALNANQVSTSTVGILTASKDIFLNVSAYQFSASFFKPRGYNSKDEMIMINGVSMNKIFNGNPQWSNWGGLNDVLKNQVFANGIAASDYDFGGLANTTNIIIRASKYKKGGRISYASSNRTYKNRAMFTYSSGLNKKGWAYVISASKRYADEGYIEGSSYNSNSIFLGFEKKINPKHSLSLNAFYTPNLRGKSSAITQEVLELKNSRYNAFWGSQHGDQRSARTKYVNEPLLMLNHFWQVNNKLSINTNIAYQFGAVANSRLDYGGSTLYKDNQGNEYILGGGTNPDPTYYQKLPSYYLRGVNNPDYEGAYLAQKEFQSYGQIDWEQLFLANTTVLGFGGNSVYALYDDVNQDNQLNLNAIFDFELNSHILLNGNLSYKNLKSKNYALMKDLLGGKGYLDIDGFAENILEAQNNLDDPNRVVKSGDEFRYNYEVDADVISVFAQGQFNYNKIDFFIGTSFSNTSYQRNGLYRNGRFIDNSFGQSKKLQFQNVGFKAGVVYKITGRHLITSNLSYRTLAPTLRNSFSNVRESNNVVYDLKSEKVTSFDFGYILRTPFIEGRFTGYYTFYNDATQVAFYYADGLAVLQEDAPVETSAFVQEVMTNVEKQNKGIELGLSIKILPGLKVNSAIAIGEYIYKNNPNLYVTSSSIKEFEDDGKLYNEGDRLDLGNAYLKNYKSSNGPQKAYSLGLEYRDPDYWWFSISGNYFSNTYVSISNIMRTKSFATDYDGLPIHDYNPEIAKSLLKQEQFDSYFVLNAVGGKSWRLKNNYIGFTVALGNITNTLYKTGGYEQSRNANYTVLKNDKARGIPLFGSKYWYGYGATYYLNIYYRF